MPQLKNETFITPLDIENAHLQKCKINSREFHPTIVQL